MTAKKQSSKRASTDASTKQAGNGSKPITANRSEGTGSLKSAKRAERKPSADELALRAWEKTYENRNLRKGSAR